MLLVEDIYRLTPAFPREDQFGLSSQMRRAAVSVPSNIAEDSARSGTKELLYFLGVATGSLAELDTQLDLALRLEYLHRNHLYPVTAGRGFGAHTSFNEIAQG